MSWKQSLDGLMASRHFHQAAIMGRSGGILAISPGFGLSQSEQDAIVRMFSGPYTGRDEDIVLNGFSFTTTYSEGRRRSGRRGERGCHIVSSRDAIIVAEYADPVLPGSAQAILDNVVDSWRIKAQ